jgi:hypothetical protein
MNLLPLLLAVPGTLSWSPASREPATPGIAAPQERRLKDSEITDLAKKLSDWLEAATTNRKKDEAQAEVRDELEKLQKKLKGTDPLSLPADFGAALYMSYDYKKGRPKRGKVDAMEAQAFGSKSYEFAVSAPSTYNPAKLSYPLLICIPDEKQQPSVHLMEDWTSAEIKEGCILASPPMPEDVSLWTKSGDADAPGGVAYVLTTLGAVRNTYAIDFDKVFLVGKGRGVEAAVAIAEMFPERFAGVIGRSGGPGSVEVSNFKNLPTLFTGGDAHASDFQKKTEELGFKNCTLIAEGKEPEVWGWIGQKARVPNPNEVNLVPGNPFPKRAYWIEVPPIDDATRSARVTARIERETNTIRIEAHGVQELTIYFNDQLVDLDQPVRVVINGAESKDQIPRNLIRTLDLIFRASSDPGRIYVESKTYAVPAPPGESK